ncbi:hypothetical protein IFVP136_C210033 [Vibrio parahaemolyticus]
MGGLLFTYFKEQNLKVFFLHQELFE